MHRFLSVLLALVASPAVGQPEDPWVFDRIYSGDGLSHNSVYAIHQDRDGFMWFGTLDGLNRYDGYEFVVHRHDPADSTSLSHNVVTVFHEDPDGTLWVGTGGGLNRLGADTPAFRRYALFPDRPGEPWVGDIERDPRGTLWVSAGDNLYWYDEPRDQMVTDATLSGGMRALRPGPDDDLWVLRLDEGTAERSLCRIDASARGVRDCSRLIGAWGAVSEFLMDPDGSVWFDHTGRAIKTNGTLAPSGPVADYRAPAIRRLNDGTRVIGSAGDGIYRCRDASPCVQSLIDPRRPTWLHNYVRSLYQDRAGGLWVGTYGGVYRRDPNRKPFRVHRHDPAESADARDDASVNAISALARTSNGTLWVGTFGNGLSRLDEATGMLTTEPSWSPRLGTVIWDLMVRKDGSLWAGTDRGLVEVDPASGQHRLRSFPTDDGIPRQITVLEEDAEGRLWLGSFRELLSLDAARTTVYPTTGGSSGTSGSGINSLVADDASLWIGLQGGIVNRLDLSTGRFSEHTPVSALGVPQTSETTYDLHLDPEGLLWVASGAGLFRYEPSAGRFTQFTTAQGLPGSVVYLVQPDTQGQHWLGTNRGLARLDPAGESFTTYELSDGIGVLEFNRHARWMDPDGRVWLGGANGLLSFDPAEIRQDSSRSPVALTRISMASREGQTEIDPRAVETLVLPPGVSTVSLTFAALGFVAPDRQRYRYRLEGFDEDWVESGTQRRARYTNLPPGRYTFQVVAANADGVWNDEGFSLPVVVEPAVWQTAWFKWLVALAVLGALTAVYRARVQRLLALERLRLRIAGDLHDDLAGDLSGIALAADLLRHHVPEDAARTRLDEIRDTASGMVESLRDIVWTINPEHDTLEALVRRMRAVARQLLARHQHSLRVDLPDEQRAVPMPIRHDLLLLYKEALHNVVRHAEAGQVQVVLGRENGSILLSVEDDGRGFDPLGAGSRGHGLRSMRQRAERMGGSLSVTSSPGEGTRLVVEIPIARTRDGRSTAWGLS